jgi:triacylglycerol esterase/lipase EstA (alpha/beta hydrolase family)
MSLAAIKFPIILIHGWTDKPAETGTWKVVERTLIKKGIHFFVPSISRFGSIEERSRLLIKEMKDIYPPGQAIHLIGHSMVSLVRFPGIHFSI